MHLAATQGGRPDTSACDPVALNADRQGRHVWSSVRPRRRMPSQVAARSGNSHMTLQHLVAAPPRRVRPVTWN